MLILLSSGARRRYRDDVVRALAHPAGTELRFRYDSKYVEPSVLGLVRAKTLVTQTVLICHLAEQPNDKLALVVPCRFATVSRAQLIGTSVILTLSTGAYVHQLDDGALRNSMTAEELKLLPGQGSADTAPPGRFAFPIEAPLTANAAPTAAEAAAFETTAKALRTAGFGADDTPMPFYAVRDLVEIGDKTGEPARSITVKEGRYPLQSGKRYAVDVYSYAPEGEVKPSDASTLTVEVDDSEVKFSSATAAKLDSRYDLNRFRFSSEPRLLSLPTGLRIALGTPIGTDGKNVETRCDITLELDMAGSGWLAVGRIVLIAIGTATPAIIGAYAAQKGSLGLAAFMILAAIATGIGTVLPAFKK